ncbi:MAG: serine/threonine-protein kinase [Archangium sp.]|nr:serine/threonine-protein kinase [Archangium sp.]
MRVCTVCQEPVPSGMPVCPRDGGAAEEPGDEIIGTMIGEYRVKGVIGEGGMGQVYEGLQPVIGKRVAIKLLRRELATDKVEAARLLGEARSVNAIGHRGIIDIFSFGALPDGRQYFVMEHLSGVSLSQHIRMHGALPVEDTLKLLDEMLAALGAAHGAGVIHRDFKPSNIFLVAQPDGSSFVKLLDFGIAKIAPYARGETPQTRVSRVMGTPEFMAPEQARGQPVGPRTDLYALGVVAFAMLTGEHLFDADNPYEIVNMHLSKAPRVPSSVRSEVPPEVDSLVLSLLEKDPQDRPPSAEAVREQLKRLRKALHFNATRLALAPTSMTRESLGVVPSAPPPPAPSAPKKALADSATRHSPSSLGPDKATRILNAPRATPPQGGSVDSSAPQLEQLAPSERRAMRVGGAVLFLFAGLLVTGLWVLLRKPPAPEPVPVEVVEAVVVAPAVPQPQVVEPRPEIDPRDTAAVDAVRAEVARSETARTEAARLEAELADAARAEAAKVAAAKAEAAKAAAAKAEAARIEAARAEAAKVAAAKADAPKADPLQARYKRIQGAWAKSRASRSPEDRRIFDVMLSEVGKQLTGGSRAEATESLNDFVAGALNGKEP